MDGLLKVYCGNCNSFIGQIMYFIQFFQYKKITRYGNLNKVLESIKIAQKNNIKIKINTVAIKNFNEEEFENIAIWCSNNNMDLSFIEVMPMNETDLPRHLQFLSMNKVFNKLKYINSYHYLIQIYESMNCGLYSQAESS